MKKKYKVTFADPMKAYFRGDLPLRDRQDRLHFFRLFHDRLQAEADTWKGMRTPGDEEATFQWAMRYDVGSHLRDELGCEALLFTFQISDRQPGILEVRAVSVKEVRPPFSGN